MFKQIHLPAEIIIADDGSDADTSRMIASLQQISPISIIHSWQENKGFRLSRSRNKAINIAKGDYIVLIDGDIVIEKNFIGDHLETAKTGYFIQGSRVLINEKSSQLALEQKELIPCFTDPGVANRKNCIRSKFLSKLFSFASKRLPGIKTCNFAFWKEDAENVNGFNEDFVGWGREDSEFTARLLHSGIKRQNLKFKAVAYHLYHKNNSRRHLEDNDKILANTVKNKLTWCKNGLNLHGRGQILNQYEYGSVVEKGEPPS